MITSLITQDVEKYLERSTEGFIYISFGSLIKTKDLPLPTVQVFLNVIRQFPKIQFVWKWDKDALNQTNAADLPSNLLVRDWFNQQAILRNDSHFIKKTELKNS